jgi:glycerate 2-kinase
VDWLDAGHPFPDERSVAAGHRVLQMAAQVGPHEQLVLLLSGGASALVAAPLPGITLQDKQQAIRLMMHAGADISALNVVRKHMSAIKGGRLAAACRGSTLTLAISDVVGDDVSVIGSGPGVADRTTWRDALDSLERFGGADELVEAVLSLFRRGLEGEIPDTPKPDNPALARTEARVIGSRRDALEGARLAAVARGYHVVVLDEPIVGEARLSARPWLARVLSLLAALPRPTCALSAGETTVRVEGHGRGGRNQEFVLALADSVAMLDQAAVVASIGTDGVDGPTDAAGAIVDATSLQRAQKRGLGSPDQYLDDNNSFAFFDALGDLIRTGPTDTNVGDLQALLIG